MVVVFKVLRYVAIALVIAAIAMLAAYAVTSQHRLLSGGLIGVLMGGTTLSWLRQTKKDTDQR